MKPHWLSTGILVLSATLLRLHPAHAGTPVQNAIESLLTPKGVPGRRIVIGRSTSGPPGEPVWQTYLLHQDAVLTDAFIDKVEIQADEYSGRPDLQLAFDAVGARLFEAFTAAHVHERLAIVLDGEVISAPVVQERIPGGRARITLGGTGDPKAQLSEAAELRAILLSSSLPAPVHLREELQTATGLRLVLGVDLVAASHERAASWAGALRTGLERAGIPFRAIALDPGDDQIRIELPDEGTARTLAASIEMWHIGLTARHDGFQPRVVHISERVVHRGERALEKRFQAVMKRRLQSLGIDGAEVGTRSDLAMVIDLPGGSLPESLEPASLKAALLRRGRLEFVRVDDRTDYTKAFAGRPLPNGIQVEAYPYHGPNDQTVIARFFSAEGPGAKRLLRDMLSNIPEIVARLAELGADPAATRKIVNLIRQEPTSENRQAVLKVLGELRRKGVSGNPPAPPNQKAAEGAQGLRAK